MFGYCCLPSLTEASTEKLRGSARPDPHSMNDNLNLYEDMPDRKDKSLKVTG